MNTGCTVRLSLYWLIPRLSLPLRYHLVSTLIFPWISGICQTVLYFHCLHNTPVISMGTSPGMAGGEVAPVCDTPFPNKWFSLSLTYQRVQEVNLKLSSLDCWKGGWVFREVWIWSWPPVQSPEDAADKQKGTDGPPNRLWGGPVISVRLISKQWIYAGALCSAHRLAWFETCVTARAVKQSVLPGQWREITQ